MAVEEKELARKLKTLGKTATGVRRKLGALGVKGVVGDSTCCAVAQYLRQEFPDEEVVEVDGGDIKVNGATVLTPRGVKEFISDFDDSDFPELIKHAEGCAGVKREQNDECWLVWCDCARVWRGFYLGESDDAATESRRYYGQAKKALA